MSYPYTIQHSYTPDFVLPDNGEIERLKAIGTHHLEENKQVIQDNPRLTFAMVFQDPYKRISKKSKLLMQSGVSDTELMVRRTLHTS